MRITMLGTGTSTGVPVIGCDCPVCRSVDPRDSRTRASLVVASGETRMLVDAGPEFRVQALREKMGRVDALFLTHAHADHVHGLDDLRVFTYRRVMPVYGNQNTLGEIKERFSYIFRETQLGGGKPRVELMEMPESGIEMAGIRITPVPVKHGALDILGYRFSSDEAPGGGFAYLTDVSFISERSFDLLAGVEALVIDGLRFEGHPTHFSIPEAVEAARRIGAGRSWLTHLGHEAGRHADLIARLEDKKIEPAFDGLSFECR